MQASALLLFLLAAPDPQAGYRLTVIAPTGGSTYTETACTDISDWGRAVGGTVEAGVPKLFEWTATGGIQMLTHIPWLGTLRVNNLGDAILAGAYPAVIYLADGNTIPIPPLNGAGDTALWDLNDDLTGVGWANNSGTTSTLLVWDPIRGSRSIYIPAASVLVRVNAGQMAVGNIKPYAGTSDGFVVDVLSGVYQTFNTLLGGAWSEVVDVNEWGMVAGTVSHGTVHEAFVWDPAAGFTFLPGLAGGPAMYVRPRAIDNAGRVVGSALTGNSDNHAFLWDPASGMVDLNGLLNTGGFQMTDATDLSETGVVIGRGFYGTTWGPSRGFILEFPAPWEDLGYGLAGTSGMPSLAGAGSTLAGTTLTLALENALPSTTGSWVVGFAPQLRAFRGGTMVPRPDRVIPFQTDAGGRASLAQALIPALPPGFEIYAQAWIQDPGAVQGAAASNTVRAIVP